MKKIKKEQLKALNFPILSGRFHPYNITAITPVIIFFMLTGIVFANSIKGCFQFDESVNYFLNGSIIITIIFFIQWILFLKKNYAIKYQKIQFAIFVFEFFCLGIELIFMGVMALGAQNNLTNENFNLILLIVFCSIIIILIFSTLILIKRIYDDEYIINSKTYIKRKDSEFIVNKKFLGSTSFILIILSMFIGKNLKSKVRNIFWLSLILLSMSLIYIIPELIIISYCKFKYKDFNVNK